MRFSMSFGTAALAAAVLASVAGAQPQTVATFADPSGSGANPLFSFSGGTLSGGWNQPGLTLETPGLPLVPDFSNASFSLTPLTATPIFGPFWALSGGSINFFDSLNNPLLTISFASATLTTPSGFGSSDFVGNNVTFSGPILAGFISVSQEAFSFSFANPVGTPTNYTATSSFTSSAELIIPTPGAAALLGLGGLIAARRRR